jgi:serine/threonine protein kinase
VTNGISYSVLREITTLKKLKGKEGFVEMLDVIFDKDSKRSIYCVFEYYQHTLGKMLTYHVETKIPMKKDKIKKIIYQILMGIDKMHSMLLLHRDIKPDNILVKPDGDVVLADFGLSKKAAFTQRRKSNSIVSLWYRAPEIVLGSEDYFY